MISKPETMLEKRRGTGWLEASTKLIGILMIDLITIEGCVQWSGALMPI